MFIKHKIAIGLMVSILLVVGLSFVVWKIANKPNKATNAPVSAKQKRDIVPTTIKRPAKETPEISQEDIEKAIAFLDELDKSDDHMAGSVIEKPSTEINDKKPLSYEEELVQRFLRIKETPEYKAVNDRFNELAVEAYGLGPPASLERQFIEYQHNPYSVFGLTKEEGHERKWSEEDLEYMRLVGQKLEQQMQEYLDEYRANERERDGLHQKRLELMGMTNKEFSIAVALFQKRR